MTYSFVDVRRKSKTKWRRKISIIGYARVSTLEIKFIKADKLGMTVVARLANMYSNKSTRGVTACVAALNFSFIRTLIKTGNVTRMSSRRRRGNSLRIKITLGRKPRRGFFVFRRRWFTRFSRARRGKWETTREREHLQRLGCISH